MFTERYTRDQLRALNLPVAGYHPFPTYAEPDKWLIREDLRAVWVKLAESYLTYEWPAITAEMYLAVKDTGQLLPHWTRFRERRSGLGLMALAECMEHKGRFIHQIVNGIISTCEETTWINPLGMKPHGYALPTEKNHEVDLTTSESASLLLWIDYLLGDELDKISTGIRKRLRDSIRARFIKPYMERRDYWWMGFTDDRTNNWNPWCNMNAIMCALLIEDDPDARADMLYKVMQSLDRYVETFAPDGCCDEGPMYWGAAGGGLFICLELLAQASGGAVQVFDEGKLRLIGQYIKKVHIDGDWFVNYADGDAHVTVDSTTFRFGQALQDTGMMGLGAAAPTQMPRVYEWFRAYLYMQDIFTEPARLRCKEKPEYPRDAWFDHTGVMTARETAGSPKGFFLSAKAGHNNESHNHNDIGNFLVYYDGQPVIIDIGTEEYSAKTFGPQRYEIWYTQSQYHNCPGVGGVLQSQGRAFYADAVRYEQDALTSRLHMELRNAYPAEAGIHTWQRSIGLTRGPAPCVSVRDTFSLPSATAEVFRYLITLPKPTVQGREITLASGENEILIQLDTDAHVLVEEIALTDHRLRGNWGEVLYRIVIKETHAVAEGERTMRILARKAGRT